MAKTAWRFRDSLGIAVRRLVVWTSADAEDVPTSPTITSGSGVPSTTPPDGSIYLRTDGSTGDDSLYMMIGSSWKALQGETT